MNRHAGPITRKRNKITRRWEKTCERMLNPMSAARRRPGEVAPSVFGRVAERREERRMPRRMTRNGHGTDRCSLAWLVGQGQKA